MSAKSGTKPDNLPNAFTSTIVSVLINDVAMTVLPDAPVDPATGLPVPTIAVATDAGVSVIKDDGNVWDVTITNYAKSGFVALNGPWLTFNQGTSVVTRGLTARLDVRLLTGDLSFSSSDTDYILGSVNGYGSTSITPRFLDNEFKAGAAIDESLLVRGHAGGLSVLKSKVPAGANTPDAMIAYVTSGYNTGWMNGDIKGAFLSSTSTASLVASGELVTNGDFPTDTSGWTVYNNATLSVVSGRMRITNGATGRAGAGQSFSTTPGKVYRLTFDAVSGSSPDIFAYVGTNIGGASVAALVNTNGLGLQITFVAQSTTTWLTFLPSNTSTGSYIDVDNISVKLADADRSVNNNGLIVNGTITRAAVATGADLVAYSGFSASNYLEQPYNPDLDFGTGDFCVMGWVNGTKSGQILDRFDAAETGARFSIVLSGSYTRFFTSSGFFDASALSAGPTFVVMLRKSSVLYGYINGLLVGSIACPNSLTNTAANLRVGTRANTSTSQFLGSLALLRISATAPTADQIRHIYETEKALFQENAACTLYGSSDAVTALAHDPVTKRLHVGTSAGRSVFQGLRRVANTTTAVTTAISANNDMVIEQ